MVVLGHSPHPYHEEDEDEPLRLLLFAGRDSLSVAKPLAVFPKDELSDPCAVSIPKAWSGDTEVRERMPDSMRGVTACTRVTLSWVTLWAMTETPDSLRSSWMRDWPEALSSI